MAGGVGIAQETSEQHSSDGYTFRVIWVNALGFAQKGSSRARCWGCSLSWTARTWHVSLFEISAIISLVVVSCALFSVFCLLLSMGSNHGRRGYWSFFSLLCSALCTFACIEREEHRGVSVLFCFCCFFLRETTLGLFVEN
ncbi:hypothetical protein V8F20_000067 [Naviculisporaceae sp. PSN 640]